VLLPAPPVVAASMGPTTPASGLPHSPHSMTATLNLAALGSGYTPICLTVRGMRLSPSGPVVEQPVSASVCGYTSVSVLDGLQVPLDGALLMVALAQRGPRGLVEVAGYAAARRDGAGGGAPNRLVHFAGEETAGSVEFLRQALRESRRDDAATAVLAILTPDQLAKARYTEGVIYAEDQGGAWARAFGVKTTRRPVTLIVGPNGDLAWQHEGELDTAALAAALREKLVSGGSVGLAMLRLSLRIGRRAPNFFFAYAPGRGLTLRNLTDRPAVLVFWRSSSKPSIETVRDLQKTAGKAGAPMPVVLAINDGEAPELAKKVAAENRLSATLVPDPERKISLAYGVSLWPTVVFIDPSGLVREIRYGRLAGETRHD
jgi:peroxiredoxin